ncbi:MAG: ATP-binding cassette domain-containing protein [Dysgonamonadaceae bacterium]|jgi:zinc transport system ATP-binding protein|nr:ATP-binding cassette domain-containing protein [Dysgonamonadaceae bacterium]
MNKVLVDIEHVSAGYQGEKVVDDVSFRICEQDFWGITGPNGGGKTTLIKVILGLLPPLSGTVRFADKQLKNRIGYMPQTHLIDRKFPILVSEVIASGLCSEKSLTADRKKERVRETIQSMGLDAIAAKPIGELSGGQLQRTLLARAIINRPELLILDEPNAYIDNAFETYFYDLLQEMNRTTAIVLISHDRDAVAALTKKVLTLNGKKHE